MRIRILDIHMSFQFIDLWTRLDLTTWIEKKGHSRNLVQENDIMDLRGISSLMARQQAIKMNYSHEWIDMVTKMRNSKHFCKPYKLTFLDRFPKAITLEHLKVFKLEAVSFSIFDLCLISKDILTWHIPSFIDYSLKQLSKIFHKTSNKYLA
jgi:hypothetical protein